MFRSFLTHLLFMLLPHLFVLGDCPPGCVCMWKSGKESTECINQDKNEIPQGIEPSTQVLNIRGNSIRILEDNIFLQLGITNLQRLYCSYCMIREVQPRAFRRLTNLIELDISENSLKEVPTESWKYTKALMKLSLSGNPIKLIRGGAFKRLTFVTNLHLAHCEIETIEAEAFTSLESLLELKLENNRLTYITGAGLFPRSLHQIEIHGNPFHCDCRLLDFVDWVQESGVPRSLEPLCYRPLRLENASISHIDLEELACLPQVEPAVLKTVVIQGSTNVTLRCSVFGIPRAIVSWWHSNRLVANGTNLDHPWERQYYLVKEIQINPHKLISEIVIFEIRPEDNGFFYCSASNPAGVVRANFTLQVIPKSEIDPQVKTTKEEVSSIDVESLNDKEDSEKSNDMLKVEYILGFGAAAVVVLTILIIMILYLVLQCRSRRYKSRLARALHCDSNSNSNSYIERSTVDFIVPGEMELTSAVRSVSCSSVISKCNKDGSKVNSADEQADKDEDEYSGRARRTPRALRPPLYMEGPPSYKHPPPPNQHRPESLCRCCGEPQWRHPNLPPMGYFPQRFVTPYQEAQHIRDCPRNGGRWNCDGGAHNYMDGLYNGESLLQQHSEQHPLRSNSLRNPKKYFNRPYQFATANNNLHYVTMSRGMPGGVVPRGGGDFIRYATSQPHLNGGFPSPRTVNSMHPNHTNILTPMSLETSITLPRTSPNTPSNTPRYPYLPRQPPRYSLNGSFMKPQPIPESNTGSKEEPNNRGVLYTKKSDDDYLFPDLPPPPDASLPIIKNGSRSSSLDDLSSGQDNSSSRAPPPQFYTLPNHPPSAQARRRSYKSRNASLSMGSNVRQPNNNNLFESSAVRVDLSESDKTIRRPGSAPDLAVPNSPVRSVLRNSRFDPSSASSMDRRSIIINPSSKASNKKVMFSGVSDEGEENSTAQEVLPHEQERQEDPIWVLRSDKPELLKPDPVRIPSEIPVTGIVIAQPSNKGSYGYVSNPPKIIPNPLSALPVVTPMAHHSSSESSSGTVSNMQRPNIGRGGGTLALGSSAGSSSSVTSVVTPPMISQQQPAGLSRPGNPALQRPGQPHFHESPDEGYHEEDGGSETL